MGILGGARAVRATQRMGRCKAIGLRRHWQLNTLTALQTANCPSDSCLRIEPVFSRPGRVRGFSSAGTYLWGRVCCHQAAAIGPGPKNRRSGWPRPFGGVSGDAGDQEEGRPRTPAAIGREAVYIVRHDVVLWVADRQLFALDCRNSRMAELNVELPEGLYTLECALVYDPTHDVCVALISGSFSGPMQTLLFRFDPKTAEYR